MTRDREREREREREKERERERKRKRERERENASLPTARPPVALLSFLMMISPGSTPPTTENVLVLYTSVTS